MKKRIAQLLWAPAMASISMAQAHNSAEIEELIITASPHGKNATEIAGTVNILSGADLQRAAANTLGETLKDQIGINTSSFGPGVGVPVIRGLSGNRVEILQNSMPLTDASSTSPDHAIAQEPLLADRIEILRGPAVLRFGPGAIGGVINIIDDRIHLQSFSGAEAAIEARYNNNGDGKAVVGRADLGDNNYSAHISGMTRESNDIDIPKYAAEYVDEAVETTDGYIANSDMNAHAYNLGFSKVTDQVVMGLAMSYLKNDYGIPPSAHIHQDDSNHDEVIDYGPEDAETLPIPDEYVRINMEQTEYSSKLQLPQLSGLFNSLFLDLSHSDYQHTELEFTNSEKTPGTRYKADSNSLRLELLFDAISSWAGYLGLQYQDTNFDVSGDEAFVPPNKTRLSGAFITAERSLLDGTLGLGLRYDRQTNKENSGVDDSFSLVNASASYLYPVNDSNQLSMVFTHAERAPSAEELFALGEHLAINRYQIGNPLLNREASENIEFSWRYSGQVEFTASVYHREFSDFIYQGNDGTLYSHKLAAEGYSGMAACSADPGDFDDLTEFEAALACSITRQDGARFTGLEAELVVPFRDSVEFRFWGDKVRASLDDNGDVPQMPPARLGMEVDFSTDPWSAGISVTRGFDQNRPGNFDTDTSGYTSLDAYWSYNSDQWSLFINGKNLTNEEIRNATSYLKELAPEPGRAIELGARVYF